MAVITAVGSEAVGATCVTPGGPGCCRLPPPPVESRVSGVLALEGVTRATSGCAGAVAVGVAAVGTLGAAALDASSRSDDDGGLGWDNDGEPSWESGTGRGSGSRATPCAIPEGVGVEGAEVRSGAVGSAAPPGFDAGGPDITSGVGVLLMSSGCKARCAMSGDGCRVADTPGRSPMTCPSVGFRTMRIHGSPVAMTAAAIAAPIMTRGTSRLVALRERTMIGSAGGTQVESDSDGVVTESRARPVSASSPPPAPGRPRPRHQRRCVDGNHPPLGDDASSSARRSNKASRFPGSVGGVSLSGGTEQCVDVFLRRRPLEFVPAARRVRASRAFDCHSAMMRWRIDAVKLSCRSTRRAWFHDVSLRPPQRMVTETPSAGRTSPTIEVGTPAADNSLAIASM